MKKIFAFSFFYLLFTPSLMYGGAFNPYAETERNNICACTEEEREALKEHFAGYTHAEKVRALRRVASAQDLDKPETFRELRSLFCHLGMHEQWQTDHYFVYIDEPRGNEDYFENELLQSAIKSDSKDFVKFLCNNYFYEHYFKEYAVKMGL